MCIRDRAQTMVYNWRGEAAAAFTGRLRLSPNGRWGLLTALDPMYFSHSLVEIDTVTRYPIAVNLTGGRDWRQHGVANNGAAVLVKEKLVVFRPPDKVQILEAHPQSAAIDAGGTMVVWTELASPARSLRLLRLADTFAGTVSLAVPGREDYAPQLSQDGARILFLSRPLDSDDPQAFVMESGGTGRRPVTAEPEGIRAIAFSGNGQAAWALTRTGRVLHIVLDTGETRQVIGPVPAFLTGDTSGGLGQILTPAASVLPGDELEIEGIATPLLKAGNGAVTFQIPWDLEAYTTYMVGLRPREPTGWEGGTLRLVPTVYAPWFVRHPNLPDFALAAHGDFSALITPENPARAGEIVHLYAEGLGPVDPPVETGQPAPVSPLARVAAPVRCYIPYGLGSADLPVELFYAGLAPGMIGYYQISVRLPAIIPNPYYFQLDCELTLPGGRTAFSGRLPARQD